MQNLVLKREDKLNYVFAFAIVLVGTYLGILAGGKYKKRELFFSELAMFIDVAKSKISFRQELLGEIIASQVQIMKSPLKDILLQFHEMLKSGNIPTYQELESSITCNILKPDEITLVFQLLDCLGKSEVQNQLNLLSDFKIALKKFYDSALIEKNKYSVAYAKVGFLLGLVVGILVV